MKGFPDDYSLSVFEKYYQREYDYDTTSLSEFDIGQIRQVAKEKRVSYGIAPIGENIFDLMASQCPFIRFEAIEFDSDVDAILYISPSEQGKSYVVLNSKKPLVNQIFASAHEYYHYIHDYEKIKHNPRVCDFKSLDSIMEKRASRFAAELLLPSEALRAEIAYYKTKTETTKRQLEFHDYGALSIYLLVKYQLPLKSIFFRFHEEGIIKKPVEKIIQDYCLIKNLVAELVKTDTVDIIKRLYDNKNPHINNADLEYKQLQNAYNLGRVTREEVLEDSKILNLDEEKVKSFFDEIIDDEEELSPKQMETLKALWRK